MTERNITPSPGYSRGKRFLLLLLLTLFSSFALQGQTHTVRVCSIDGTINPATSDYIHEEIRNATENKSECLIIRLNTPGGLLKSTRVIVSDFLDAPLPIIVYVSPSGSQAASAGAFITLAAHIAAMAPGTNIGAAHPVTLGEQQDSIMMAKTTNDAAAFIRTISEKRNRNIQWAEDAVRKSISITESEALKQHVIDTIATTVNDLLKIIDGKEIKLTDRTVTLHTADATIEIMEKPFQQKLLDIISDPNIAYILMMLGIYGLLFELYNPGSIFPGIVGFVCLVLAFYSMHTLPINYAGLALIIFGIILFLLEIKIVSHGLLTIGAVISLALGSIMLIRTDSMLDVVSISWEVIALAVTLSALFFIFAIGLGIKAQRKKPTTGKEGIIGETGEAVTDLTPLGSAKVHGEFWNVSSLDGTIVQGTKIRVESIDHLTLHVKKYEH
jgi:membrane-bound serine protease (ClpP class)